MEAWDPNSCWPMFIVPVGYCSMPTVVSIVGLSAYACLEVAGPNAFVAYLAHFVPEWGEPIAR